MTNSAMMVVAAISGNSSTPSPPPPPLGTLLTEYNLGFAGDSNTVSVYPGFVGTALTAAYPGIIHQGSGAANAGYTINQVKDILYWSMWRYFDPNRVNILKIQLGTNDINNGSTAAITYADLKAFSLYVLDYGFQLDGTLFFDPNRDGSGNNTKPEYLTLVPMIRAGWHNDLKWRRIMDASLYPEIAGYNPAYNANWGSGGADHLHYSTPVGYQALSDRVVPVIESLMTDSIYMPASPTDFAIDGLDISCTPATGYPATSMQYTLNGGATIAGWLTSLPHTLTYGRKAGLVGIRVGPLNGNNPSPWLFNEVDIVGPEMPNEFVPWFDLRMDVPYYWNRQSDRYIYVNGPDATITFEITEGFCFRFDYGIFGGGEWEAFVDGVSVGTGTQSGAYPTNIIIEHHTGNTSPKTVELKTLVNGSGYYNIFSGVTLYV